jgi:hypothetical protein
MDADQLTDILGCNSTSIGGGFDRTNISTNQDCDQARPDALGTDQRDIGGLDHRIGGFNGSNETSRFYHS